MVIDLDLKNMDFSDKFDLLEQDEQSDIMSNDGENYEYCEDCGGDLLRDEGNIYVCDACCKIHENYIMQCDDDCSEVATSAIQVLTSGNRIRTIGVTTNIQQSKKTLINNLNNKNDKYFEKTGRKVPKNILMGVVDASIAVRRSSLTKTMKVQRNPIEAVLLHKIAKYERSPITEEEAKKFVGKPNMCLAKAHLRIAAEIKNKTILDYDNTTNDCYDIIRQLYCIFNLPEKYMPFTLKLRRVLDEIRLTRSEEINKCRACVIETSNHFELGIDFSQIDKHKNTTQKIINKLKLLNNKHPEVLAKLYQLQF